MHYSLALLIACASAIAACATEQPQPTAAPAGTASADQSLLASSTPAHGSVVSGPVHNIELHFARPARLLEVTVAGADGSLMPMMVHSVGEVVHYSLPASVNEGSYTVRWRASSGGTEYQGQFSFQVR